MSGDGNRSIVKHFRRYGALYIMLILPMTVLILFHYVPMYGVQIAFRNYRITRGIADSPWVGFKYFIKFFRYHNFWQIIRNTLVVNLYSLLTFPLSLILALLLAHVPFRRFAKIVQNASYVPHFISMVVLCSMVIQFTNARTGMINSFLGLFGVPPVNYMAKKEYYYSIYVWSGVWQNLGYSSIIYIAALAGISPELHEAAIMDGASIVKRIWHIDVPGVMPTFCILLIMRCGSLMNVGFEKALLLQNSLNMSVSEVISTYSYNIGLNSATPQYSYASAIGLFTSVINLIMLCLVNSVVKRVSDSSLW
ncbi:MAG: ABC transporter permease subunit [Eubacteriales bacterium]|nr:ABC transporter permease subunit [Eubacteriales bacterium]